MDNIAFRNRARRNIHHMKTVERFFLENSFIDANAPGEIIQDKYQTYHRLSVMVDLREQAKSDIINALILERE